MLMVASSPPSGCCVTCFRRNHLEDLSEADADTDKIYQHARGLSHTFRDGLLEFFFDPRSEMDELTKNYGVF